MSDAVIPDGVYERVAIDLDAGQLQGTCVELPFEPSVLKLEVTETARQEIERGAYVDWECANERYQVASASVVSGHAWLEFAPAKYDVRQVSMDYLTLPGILGRVDVATQCELQGPGPHWVYDGCAEGEAYYYLRRRADDAEGTLFASGPDQAAAPVCEWSEGEMPCSLPDCF